MAMVATPVMSLRSTLLKEEMRAILTVSPESVERLPDAIKLPGDVCVISVSRPVRTILASPDTIVTPNAGVDKGTSVEVTPSENALDESSTAWNKNNTVKHN